MQNWRTIYCTLNYMGTVSADLLTAFSSYVTAREELSHGVKEEVIILTKGSLCLSAVRCQAVRTADGHAHHSTR